MGRLRLLLADGKVRGLLASLFLAGAFAVFLLWQFGIGLPELKQGWEISLAWLSLHGWLFFLGLVILPGLPIPSSALFFSAGIVWRDHPLMACALCCLSIALNLSWTYWLAAGPGRHLVEWFLRRGNVPVPELPKEDALKWILVLKLTPGIPYFIQNYLCGLARVPFRIYLPVALLCNGVIGAGIVLGGAGLGNGKIAPLLTGISVIVLGVVIARWLREKLARKRDVSVVPAE